MKSCNHAWGDISEKPTADVLLKNIVAAGIHGWWLRGPEIDLCVGLLRDGTIAMCEKCEKVGRKAAIRLPEVGDNPNDGRQ